MDVLFYLRSDGQYVLISDTIMAMFLLIIILCDVLIDSDDPFYLRSDGHHILFGDALMAVLFG